MSKPLQAEQLPSEIWLHIFTFFEGHDLVRTFSCLNSFFDALLHSPHSQLYIQIKQNESNERLPQLTWSHIDLQNIYSLSVGRRKANCLIQFLRWNAPYLTRLRSLSVYLRKANFYNNVQFLIFAIGQIPSLNRIRIKYASKINHVADNFNLLMSYIFSERFIAPKCLFVSDMSDYNMITSEWSINPSLKYLGLGDMPLNNVYSILSFTPQLYFLKATIDASPIILNENVVLTHLKKANLYVGAANFSQLENFKKAAPNLKALRLRGRFNYKDEKIFEETLWHGLLKNIQYFYVDLKAHAYSESMKIPLRNHITHYSGQSWFSHDESTNFLIISIKYKSTTL